MVKLTCALVGNAGVFGVKIDDSAQVWELKDAIKGKNSATITCDAKDLQLFLAKTADGAWLPDESDAALELEEGKIHAVVQTLIDGVRMRATWTIKDVLEENHMTTPQSRQVHVLVVVPKDAVRDAASFAVKEMKVAMNEVLDERDEQLSVYSISACSVSKQEKLVGKLGYQYTTIDVMEEIHDSIKPYAWLPNIAEEVQRRGYIQYLKDNLRDVLHQDGSTATRARTSPRLKPKFHLEDTSQNKTLLNCNASSSLPFGVTGTADLMIIDEAAKAMGEVFAGLHFVIELKKEHCGGKERFQILLELVAADLKSESRCAPIGLLTNLNNYWYFLWFTPSRTIARLTLKCPANGFRMMKELLSGTTPTSTAEFPMRLRFLSLPTQKRQKLLKAAPPGDDAATEMMERYELMSDELSPEFLLARRMEYEFQKMLHYREFTYQFHEQVPTWNEEKNTQKENVLI